MKISIINGPNLNLLGTREPGLYGNQTFDEYYLNLKKRYSNIEFDYFQSNVEGELINRLQEVGFTSDLILLNAGGYTHTSVSIGDAIAAISTAVIEVHISNIHSREEFRHTTITGGACKAVISGLGSSGYSVALSFLVEG